jgi:hypothetical protein
MLSDVLADVLSDVDVVGSAAVVGATVVVVASATGGGGCAHAARTDRTGRANQPTTTDRRTRSR